MKQEILSEKEIKAITKEMGKQFTKMFKNDKKPPVFIGILKGATPFMMDLIKNIKCHIEIDFAQYSSYSGDVNTGTLILKKDITSDVTDRNVVIVEDIADSGKTLKVFKEHISKLSPKAVYTCVLLDKKCRRIVDFDADFVGKVIDDYFVVGYGLDYYECFRNTKNVFVPDEKQLKQVHKKMGIKL